MAVPQGIWVDHRIMYHRYTIERVSARNRHSQCDINVNVPGIKLEGSHLLRHKWNLPKNCHIKTRNGAILSFITYTTVNFRKATNMKIYYSNFTAHNGHKAQCCTSGQLNSIPLNSLKGG